MHASPLPRDANATAIGKANVQRPTKPEIALRSVLHARGLRFRKRLSIPLTPEPGRARRWTRPDVVFTRAKVAVYVDGCFWHGCPLHLHLPKHNHAYWADKIAANRLRDADTTRQLGDRGWAVVRAWEHEDPDDVADVVEALVKAPPRTPAPGPASPSRPGRPPARSR